MTFYQKLRQKYNFNCCISNLNVKMEDGTIFVLTYIQMLIYSYIFVKILYYDRTSDSRDL